MSKRSFFKTIPNILTLLEHHSRNIQIQITSEDKVNNGEDFLHLNNSFLKLQLSITAASQNFSDLRVTFVMRRF